MRLPRLFAGSEDAALCEVIEAVGDDAREGLCASIWPGNLYLINALRAAQTEMKTQIALGKIAATTPYLSQLLRLSRCDSDPRVQSQTIRWIALKVETDPVMRWVAFCLKDHGSSC